jgi:hypothetical protein
MASLKVDVALAVAEKILESATDNAVAATQFLMAQAHVAPGGASTAPDSARALVYLHQMLGVMVDVSHMQIAGLRLMVGLQHDAQIAVREMREARARAESAIPQTWKSF